MIMIVIGFSGIVTALTAYNVILLGKLPRVAWTLRHGKRAKGWISREKMESLGHTLLFFPVVTFRDDAGRSHEFQSRFYKMTNVRDQMDEIEVAYLPKAPKRTAVLAGFRFYSPVIAGGVVFIISTTVFIIASHRLAHLLNP
jgi:hypothetical protein